MTTQTQTSTANAETLISKILDAAGISWAVDKDKENPSSKHTNDEPKKSFFLLDMVGLSTPSLPILIIPLLIAYRRIIPAFDVFFSIAFPLYLGLANRFRFDNNARLFAARKKQGRAYPEIPEWGFKQTTEAWITNYFLFAATLGVILPLVVQMVAPSHIAEASAPHLYLLVCQIITELMVNNPRFHPMLQVINPIGFSVYRMFTLKTWLLVAWEIAPTTDLGNSSGAILNLEMLHLLLTLSNVIFWTYNTFVTLLLRILPPCLDQNKFLDANVSWEKYCQLVPIVNRSDSSKEVTRSEL